MPEIWPRTWLRTRFFLFCCLAGLLGWACCELLRLNTSVLAETPEQVKEESKAEKETKTKSESKTKSACVPKAPQPLTALQQKKLAQGTLYWLELPANSAYAVVPKVNSELASVATLKEETAVASINAGYFDPKNKLTSAFVQELGQGLQSPEANPHLMENPSLAPWLPAILNRSEWRTLRCGAKQTVRYQIARHKEAVLKDCTVLALLGAGPQLLPYLTAEEEGFYAQAPTGKTVRNPISVFAGRARSAIGLKADGSVVIAMLQQELLLKGKGGGSLPELATALKSLGVVQALNLDGGSSSALWHVKTGAILGTVSPAGETVARKVFSSLQVLPLSAQSLYKPSPIQ